MYKMISWILLCIILYYAFMKSVEKWSGISFNFGKCKVSIPIGIYIDYLLSIKRLDVILWFKNISHYFFCDVSIGNVINMSIKKRKE